MIMYKTLSVELLISAPASGKTTVCIQRICKLLAQHPFASVRVVLPDRLQVSAFRRRLAEAGGAIGVHVGTFNSLYRELLESSSQSIPVASPPIVHRLILAAIEQVFQTGGLQYYAGLRNTPGFALVLCDAFAELKRALIFPENLIEQAAAAKPAQQELARLYLAYQVQLRTLNWADPDGLSWLAVEALEKDPTLAKNLILLVVDGFDSFEGAQQRALELLASIVPNILITLPGKYPFQRTAHRRFEKVYQVIRLKLPLTVRNLPERSYLPEVLNYIETSLFEMGARCGNAGEYFSLYEARSPTEEAREALRWLKARIERDKVPLQSCAIVTPDPLLYHPYLRQAAAEFGIPLRFTQGEVLVHAPAIAALLELLMLPVLNYPHRPLLNVLRSPYFDLSTYQITRHTVDVLEEISRYGQVIEGREQWDEVFERLVQSPTPDVLESDEELGVPDLPRGMKASDLHQALNHFFDRLTPPASPRSLTEWIRWLEDLIDEWHFNEWVVTDAEQVNSNMIQHHTVETSECEICESIECYTRERDCAAFDNLREVLRALVLVDAIIDTLSVTYDQFVSELQGALEGAGYQEPLPEGQPSALVMRVLEARGVRFQVVAILGLAEGIFPVVERADPFLDETLRSSVGLDSRLQREQTGLFYQAITRSDRFLLLTRPYLADDGEKWEPSPYWKAVGSLFPQDIVKIIRPDDPRPLQDAASPEEVLFWAVRRHSLPQSFSDLMSRWEYLRHARDLLHARQAQQPEGPYEGVIDSLGSILQIRFGEAHVWSASRLEAYAACPYFFFIVNALGLEARVTPELGLNDAQLGSILHKILEKVYVNVGDPTDPQALLAVLPQIAQQEFEIAPTEQGFRPSPLYQLNQQQLLQVLENSITNLAEYDRVAGWRPVAYEVKFGLGHNPPLHMQGDRQVIHLHGVVDRVDRDSAGNIRIIDYKTGSSHQAKSDLVQGFRLQLPIYALAAQEVLGLGEVVDGFYWNLMKGEASSLKLNSFEQDGVWGLPAAAEVVQKYLNRYVSEIHQAHFPPLPARGECPAYCPGSTWCWRYSPGWGG
jgi:ATP-dependent helicase/nuclease subunit B